MPNIGDIRRGKEVGFASTNNFICARCIVCGKERWVVFLGGKPKYKRCTSCARRGKRLGEDNPSWNGGQTIHNGYIFIQKPDHPNAKWSGYVKRARLVLEQKLGRYLLPNMIPHHINSIRDDDRPENLIEMLAREHSLLHGRIAWEVHNDKLAMAKEGNHADS